MSCPFLPVNLHPLRDTEYAWRPDFPGLYGHPGRLLDLRVQKGTGDEGQDSRRDRSCFPTTELPVILSYPNILAVQ